MRYIFIFIIMILFCSCATWNGIKQDAKTGADWTKNKVHEGAVYVEQKTQ